MVERNEQHTDESQEKYTNRLIGETSPYLLQHAHNPVDWYAWGDEAFEKAQIEDKPVLLSVGYSACHWCHVMEHESFENEEIAVLMNQNFVSIKVDREERPDVDSIYMQALQLMTRQGGWPMTMFLLPDRRPFYGGTYFPPRDRHYGAQTMPGFVSILNGIAATYRSQRNEVEEQAAEIAGYLQQQSSAPLRVKDPMQPGSATLAILATASKNLREDADQVNGGFGGAPKFPNTMSLDFLLRVYLHERAGELAREDGDTLPSEMEVVDSALQHMAHGGIYDQLGGGFHRYSVDAQWLVPHFEKMLYDNALLSRVYLHAYQVTGNVFYRRVVEETLDYVAREMTAPEGGFYATQDADSEGEEGKFFLWTPEQVKSVLSAEDADLFMRYYDVTEKGNFEGKNILHVKQGLDAFASQEHSEVEAVSASLARSREILFQQRERRIKPGRDEKVLTAWNGLMLRSFAEAARAFGREDYVEIARRNANFLLGTLTQNGRLLRTYKDGRAHINGYLEDYAFLADGLLALYQTSFETRWFSEARSLVDQAIALFADEQNGGFFDTGTDHEELVSRPKDRMDNATPSGNSVMADVLLRLTAFTGEQAYRERADGYLQSLVDVMIQYPQSFGYVLGALDFVLSASKEVAVLGDKDDKETQELLACVNERFLPNSVLACAEPTDRVATEAIALLADRPLKDGRATVYVCQNFACQAPVNEVEKLSTLL